MHFNIEVVVGGFILQYYTEAENVREIFTSERKLLARVKELLEPKKDATE